MLSLQWTEVTILLFGRLRVRGGQFDFLGGGWGGGGFLQLLKTIKKFTLDNVFIMHRFLTEKIFALFVSGGRENS